LSQAADLGRSFHRSSAASPIWDAHALRLPSHLSSTIDPSSVSPLSFADFIGA
jgi:hypothetical protein